MKLQELLEKNITNGRIFAIEAMTEKKGLKGIRFIKHTEYYSIVGSKKNP